MRAAPNMRVVCTNRAASGIRKGILAVEEEVVVAVVGDMMDTREMD
jgi:hypothetical protein